MTYHPNCTDDEFDALVRYIKACAQVTPGTDEFGAGCIPAGTVLPPLDTQVVNLDCAQRFDGILWGSLAEVGVESTDLELCYLVHQERLNTGNHPENASCSIGLFKGWMVGHTKWFKDPESGIGLHYLEHPWYRPVGHPDHPETELPEAVVLDLTSVTDHALANT